MAPSICGALRSVLFCRAGAAEVAGVLGAYDQKLTHFEVLVLISCWPLLKDICGVSYQLLKHIHVAELANVELQEHISCKLYMKEGTPQWKLLSPHFQV